MIYSLLAVPDHSRIVNRFKEKYPFIEVSLIRPGASERITTRVITEARAGQHLVDVIGVSRLNMLYLIQRALVMSYDSPERQHFDLRFKDKKGYLDRFLRQSGSHVLQYPFGASGNGAEKLSGPFGFALEREPGIGTNRRRMVRRAHAALGGR